MRSVYRIYVVKYKPKVINTLLIIIIISTNTTTGYIVLTLCAIGAVYNVKGRSEISKVIIGVIIVITLIIGLHIIDNLFSSKLSSLSGQIRWKKIIDELSVFLNHPIFGDGFGKHTSGSSNSITALLADGGIFLWGLYYFPIILNAVVCFIKTKKIDFFSITYMFLLAVSVFHNTMMAILMTVIFYNRLFSLLKKKYINHIKFRR